MPRGQGRHVRKNPQAEGIFSKLVDNLYKTKKVVIDEEELVKIDKTTLYNSLDSPEFIQNYISTVQGEYQIPFHYKVNAIVMPPPGPSKKDRTLPPSPPHTMTRVVGVFFSHEVFGLPPISTFLSGKEVMVPQGSTLKITPDQSRLTYNDKTHYNKQKHPGKGFKRPEKRYIVILDFISDDPEDIKKEQEREIKQLSENDSGLISSLAKMMGLK